MNWYVYILLCKDGSYYTGITNDIEKRIKTHNLNKGAKYTRGRTPVTLMTSWKFPGKSEAAKREVQIKKLNKKQKEELIRMNNKTEKSKLICEQYHSKHPVLKAWEDNHTEEIKEIMKLGQKIGYANMMGVASALWQLDIKEKHNQDHGAFIPTLPSMMKEDAAVEAVEELNRRMNHIKELLK